MSAPAYILIGYALIGLAVGLAVGVRGIPVGGLARGSSAIVAAALWPFVAPTLLPARAGEDPRAIGRGDRLAEIASRLRDDWSRVPSPDPRGRSLLDSFVERLRAEESRIAEMESALAHAPASVLDRLARLRDATRAEVDQGIALLEELDAQLTLLRFSGEAGTRSERARVQDLLAQIEAVVEVSGAA